MITTKEKVLSRAQIEYFLHLTAPPEDFAGGCRQIYTIQEGQTVPKLLSFFRQDHDSIHKAAQKLYFSQYLPYYVTKNSFYADRRQNQTLFSLDNIVIDCDYHGKMREKDLNYEVDRLIYTLSEDYAGRMPAFNVTRSGRGLHLWIPLQSFSAKMLLPHQIFASALCGTVENAIRDINSPLQCDRTATMNAAGLIRLPFTVNTTCGRLATFEQRTASKYTLDDLQEYTALNLSADGKPIEKQFGRRCKESSADRAAYMPLHQKRIRFLSEVIAQSEDITGRRDVLLFLYCNSIMQATGSADAALTRTMELNTTLENPLTVPEVNRIADYIAKRGTLDFRVPSFLDFMNASYEERKLYQGMQSTRDAGRASNRAKKAERDQKIMDLRSKGMKQAEIAAQVGCSLRTVKTVTSQKGNK